ncbi:MAG: sugar kinase [Christensenellaceae bacterium]|nr:sugar kinase [Christensenellaceae bacterium]
MSRVVCFGEIMGRLNPEGYLRIGQARKFELSFAGGEANVAVSLANYGIDVAYVTKLPKNDLAKSVVRELRGYGVDVSHIAYGGDRLGMYYVEKGASQRPSKVIYDRKYSSISTAKREDFDWDAIFEGAQWFHFTGITPALSDGCVDICRDALKAAKAKELTISCDLNYRKNLWSSEKAGKVMAELMGDVDLCIANEEDAEKVFGIKADDTDISGGRLSREGYINVARQLTDRFGFKMVAITLRGSISASDNDWGAMLYVDGQSYFSRNYRIHIVDRVGGGDSFVGALIFALLSDYDTQRAVEFAAAASCLKHTIEFDFNQVTVDEVEKLMGGDGSGRVQR